MEGIVKISRITAQAIATLSVQAFTLGERLADEGVGQETASEFITELRHKRVIDTRNYTYVYMPDLGGSAYAKAKPANPPQPVAEHQTLC